jgi:hypothetical protein
MLLLAIGLFGVLLLLRKEMKILHFWELKRRDPPKPKKRMNHKIVRYPNKDNQLMRIARLLNHKTSKSTYGLMILVPVKPDRTHIYYIYKTIYRGDLEWAKRLAKHYKIPVENLLK